MSPLHLSAPKSRDSLRLRRRFLPLPQKSRDFLRPQDAISSAKKIASEQRFLLRRKWVKMVLAAEFPAIPSSAVKIASERRCAILVHSALHLFHTPMGRFPRPPLLERFTQRFAKVQEDLPSGPKLLHALWNYCGSCKTKTPQTVTLQMKIERVHKSIMNQHAVPDHVLAYPCAGISQQNKKPKFSLAVLSFAMFYFLLNWN